MNTNVEKTGAGTLWLTSASSVLNPNGPATYYAYGGTLRVDTTAQSSFYISSQTPTGVGATLGGSGTLQSVDIGFDSVLWPGAAGDRGTDILSIGFLSMDSGTLHVSLNGTTPGAQYDQVHVTSGGRIDTGYVALDVSVGFDAVPGDRFTIIDQAAGARLTGYFTGLPEGSTFYVGNDQFQITYQGGDGNDVVLTVLSVPEPSMGLAAIFGAAGLLLRRRMSHPLAMSRRMSQN
jgi:hypothetical protein